MTDIVTDAIRVCKETGASGETEAVAVEMATRAGKAARYDSKDARGVAAACAYAAALVTGEGDVTQEEAAEAAGVSVVTVRNNYRDVLADHARGEGPPPRSTRLKLDPSHKTLSVFDLFELYWVDGRSAREIASERDTEARYVLRTLASSGIPTRSVEDGRSISDGNRGVEEFWDGYLSEFQYRLARELRTLRINDLREDDDADG